MSRRGFSLLEMLLVLAIIVGSLSMALWLWRGQLLSVRQSEAHLALAQNARFLESWFAARRDLPGHVMGRPRLPVTSTGFYSITYTATQDLFARHERYRLKASPTAAWLGSEYLMMDQDGVVVVCSLTNQHERCY